MSADLEIELTNRRIPFEKWGGLKFLEAAHAGEPDNRRPPVAEIALIRRLYDDILRERYDRPEPRLADLEQLELIAGNFPSRSAFLAELALEPPSATQDLAGPSGTEDDAL